MRRLSEHHRGLVLVTGPTGSGKTTTLAAMVDHINHVRSCHVITIEDPIEYLHKDDLAAIDQREVGFDTDSFSSAMRTILRQDPDVILVGEMRDPETVHTALTAAETGHLVFSTLHTTTATETVNRIVDFFPPHQQGQVRVSLAGALTGTICQRLIPRADGKGRVPALEIMVVNGRIQQAILDPVQTSDIDEIMAEGEYYGMQTFDQSLAELLRDEVIDLREAMNAASNPHDLKVRLERMGIVSTGRGFVARPRFLIDLRVGTASPSRAQGPIELPATKAPINAAAGAQAAAATATARCRGVTLATAARRRASADSATTSHGRRRPHRRPRRRGPTHPMTAPAGTRAHSDDRRDAVVAGRATGPAARHAAARRSR